MANTLTTRDPFQRAAQPLATQEDQLELGHKDRLDVGVETGAGKAFSDPRERNEESERNRRRLIMESVTLQSAQAQTKLMFLDSQIAAVDLDIDKLREELDNLRQNLAKTRAEHQAVQEELAQAETDLATALEEQEAEEQNLATAEENLEQGQQNQAALEQDESEMAEFVAAHTLRDEQGRIIMFEPDEHGEVADYIIRIDEGEYARLSDMPRAEQVFMQSFITQETENGAMVLSATAGITTAERIAAAEAGATELPGGTGLHQEDIERQQAENAAYQLQIEQSTLRLGFIQGRVDGLNDDIEALRARSAELDTAITEMEGQEQDMTAELDTLIARRDSMQELRDEYYEGNISDEEFQIRMEELELTEAWNSYQSNPEITTYLANGFFAVTDQLGSIADQIKNFFGGGEETEPSEELQADEEYQSLVVHRNHLRAEQDFMLDMNQRLATGDVDRDSLYNTMDEHYQDSWREFRSYYAENTNTAMPDTTQVAALETGGNRNGMSAASEYDADNAVTSQISDTFQMAAANTGTGITPETAPTPRGPEEQWQQNNQNNMGMGGSLMG